MILSRSRVPETASYPHHFAKRLGEVTPVLLCAWITCSLRNRRHACGGTAHKAKTGCHRHGYAVAMVSFLYKRGAACSADLPEGLEAVCCARPFVCTSVAEPPLRRLRASRGKAHKPRQTAACGGRARPWQCSPAAVRCPHHSCTFVMPCAPV